MPDVNPLSPQPDTRGVASKLRRVLSEPLLHFLALAYVTAKLLPGSGWTQTWLAQQSCRMGRYSLEIFCLGVLLAPLADMVNALTDDAFAMQVFTALVGAGLMGLLGAWLDFNKRLNCSPRGVPA